MTDTRRPGLAASAELFVQTFFTRISSKPTVCLSVCHSGIVSKWRNLGYEFSSHHSPSTLLFENVNILHKFEGDHPANLPNGNQIQTWQPQHPFTVAAEARHSAGRVS